MHELLQIPELSAKSFNHLRSKMENYFRMGKFGYQHGEKLELKDGTLVDSDWYVDNLYLTEPDTIRAVYVEVVLHLKDKKWELYKGMVIACKDGSKTTAQLRRDVIQAMNRGEYKLRW